LQEKTKEFGTRFGTRDEEGRDRLLKVTDVAEELGICVATVYRLCDRAELPHVWISNSIRIRPDDLRAFLDRQTVGRRAP
jgi:excisionase family DNA binding protein